MPEDVKTCVQQFVLSMRGRIGDVSHMAALNLSCAGDLDGAMDAVVSEIVAGKVLLSDEERRELLQLWGETGGNERFGRLPELAGAESVTPVEEKTWRAEAQDLILLVSRGFICVCDHESCFLGRGVVGHRRICECPKDDDYLQITATDDWGDSEYDKTAFLRPVDAQEFAADLVKAVQAACEVVDEGEGESSVEAS